jgi:C1A family cysteine protease
MPRHLNVAGAPRHMHGWKRQPPDKRDYKFTRMAAHLPPSAMIPVIPTVRDQGKIGSCTAHAGTEAMGYLCLMAGLPDPMFSRLDMYATTRELEGIPLDEDSGCQVRDVFRGLRKYGVCLESTWPYNEAKFNINPPRRAAVEALQHQAITYLACDGLAAVKHSIFDRYPVIGGFDCYNSLLSASVEHTGVIPVPTSGDKPEGGHCVLFIGYDDTSRLVAFLNSWGPNWGKNGIGFLPYEFFAEGMASDFWTLRTQEM